MTGLAMTQRRQDYSEKRNYIRMKIAAPMSVSATTDNGERFDAVCVDLSGGGALIQVSDDQTLTMNQQIEIEARSEHSHSPTLHASAQIVRIQQQAQHQLIGLKITEVFN